MLDADDFHLFKVLIFSLHLNKEILEKRICFSQLHGLSSRICGYCSTENTSIEISDRCRATRRGEGEILLCAGEKG